MTIETEFVGRFPQLRVVVRAVNIVAGRASDTVAVHYALNEVVPLHPVLVRCAIGEMPEICLPKRDVFELPVVHKTYAYVVANRPVIGFAFNQAHTRPPLRVALDAGVI